MRRTLRPKGQEGFQYLAELDRKEYRRMPAYQKLKILGELHHFCFFLPHKYRPDSAQELTESLKIAERIKRIMKHAAT